MSEANATVTYADVWRNKTFSKLWIGQALSYVGDALSSIALPLYTLKVTGDVATLGVVFALQQLPWIFASPFAGVLADHLSRKHILLLTALVQSFCIIAVGFVVNVWLIYLVTLVGAVAYVFHVSARAAVVPDLIPHTLYPKAVSIQGITTNMTDIIGVVLGGFLAVLLGERLIFWFDGVSFLLNAMLLMTITFPKTHSKGVKVRLWDDWRKGADLLRTEVRLALLVTIMMIRGATIIGILPLMPAFIEQDLKLSAWAFGVSTALFSIGLAISTWASTRWETVFTPQRVLVWGSLCASLCFVPIAILQIFSVFIGFYTVCALFYGSGNITANILIARLSPSDMRGRVSSTSWMMIKSAQALSSIVYAQLATLISISGSMLLAALPASSLCLAVAFYWPQQTRMEAN